MCYRVADKHFLARCRCVQSANSGLSEWLRRMGVPRPKLPLESCSGNVLNAVETGHRSTWLRRRVAMSHDGHPAVYCDGEPCRMLRGCLTENPLAIMFAPTFYAGRNRCRGDSHVGKLFWSHIERSDPGLVGIRVMKDCTDFAIPHSWDGNSTPMKSWILKPRNEITVATGVVFVMHT